MWATRGDLRRDEAAPRPVFLILDQSAGEETQAVVYAGSETTARRAYLAWRDGGSIPASAEVRPTVTPGTRYAGMVVVRTPRPQ